MIVSMNGRGYFLSKVRVALNVEIFECECTPASVSLALNLLYAAQVGRYELENLLHFKRGIRNQGGRIVTSKSSFAIQIRP